MYNIAELLHYNMLAVEELLQLLVGFEQEIKDQITGQHQDSILNPFNSHLNDLEPSPPMRYYHCILVSRSMPKH